jgi:hypothetical protein
MMIATTVPVSIDADAQERINQLGVQKEFDEILEHALQTVPKLVRLDVTCPYNEALGPDQQVVFDAHVTDRNGWEADLDFGRWIHAHFPTEVAINFLLMTMVI